MKKKTELKLIQCFSNEQKDYILFEKRFPKSDRQYLYFQNQDQNIRSLLFGKHLKKHILEIWEDPNRDCIECNLGTQIMGGVSFDKGDLIENGLSIKKANSLISSLKTKIKNNNNCPLFEQIHIYSF